MTNRVALSIVYDETTKKILVLNEFGAIDISRFLVDVEIVPHRNGIGCNIQASILATMNPEVI